VKPIWQISLSKQWAQTMRGSPENVVFSRF
jgi:hypothetical protein